MFLTSFLLYVLMILVAHGYGTINNQIHISIHVICFFGVMFSTAFCTSFVINTTSLIHENYAYIILSIICIAFYAVGHSLINMQMQKAMLKSTIHVITTIINCHVKDSPIHSIKKLHSHFQFFHIFFVIIYANNLISRFIDNHIVGRVITSISIATILVVIMLSIYEFPCKGHLSAYRKIAIDENIKCTIPTTFAYQLMLEFDNLEKFIKKVSNYEDGIQIHEYNDDVLLSESPLIIDLYEKRKEKIMLRLFGFITD